MIYRYRQSVLRFLLDSDALIIFCAIMPWFPRPQTFTPFLISLPVSFIILYPYIKLFGKIIKHFKLFKYFFRIRKTRKIRDNMQIICIFILLIPFVCWGIPLLWIALGGYVNPIYQLLHNI